MTGPDLLAQLRQMQSNLLEIVNQLSTDDYARQFHPDLSPTGWHLGHCVFTESYWLREVVLGIEQISDEHKALYIPELSVKTDRATALPSHNELCQWARATQLANIEFFIDLLDTKHDAKLMQNNYLLFFLCQHYAQHIETASYIQAQRNLQINTDFKASLPLKATGLQNNFQTVEKGSYAIGADNPLRHYDNECSQFSVDLDSFQIARSPVSNAEYLSFMKAEAYHSKEYWSEDGWRWREINHVSCPQHWRLDSNANYFATNAKGPYLLAADEPVSGISHHEARAFSKWANASLPHEYQWETARKLELLSNTGRVWEWCENSLHPYAGFSAFPYDGYSLPWFDQSHFTLRGYSEYTKEIIKRDSFRNFYEADKRHFPAGLRLLA